MKSTVLIDFSPVPPVPGDDLWTEDGYVFFKIDGSTRKIGKLFNSEEVKGTFALDVLGSGDGYRLPVFCKERAGDEKCQ